MIEGLKPREVRIVFRLRGRRQGGAGLGVAGDGVSRLLIGRREPLIVGEDRVEFLAEILEPAARSHFREHVLDSAVGFGGVPDPGEDAGCFLPLEGFKGRDDARRGHSCSAGLFGVAPRLQALGFEGGELVAKPAGRGAPLGPSGARAWLGRRVSSHCRRGRGGGRRVGPGLRRGRRLLRAPAKRVEDVPDGEAVEERLCG